jgi:VWFA-related protein
VRSGPLLFFTATLAASQQSPPEPVFQAGTRLVEVEVVVRDRPVAPPGLGAGLKYALDTGPPFGPPGVLAKGLTSDDFTVLDNGKPQPIAVFRAGAASAESFGGNRPLTVPPGAVSNRQDSRGQPLNGATAVLIDFLNTPFRYTDYARMSMKNLLRSVAETDNRIAVYTLGRNLRLLHDFTDDPRQLIEAAAKLDRQHGPLPSDLADSLRDFGDVVALESGEETAADIHGKITLQSPEAHH